MGALMLTMAGAVIHGDDSISSRVGMESSHSPQWAIMVLVYGLSTVAFLRPVPGFLLGFARVVVFLHGVTILVVSALIGACAGVSFGASSHGIDSTSVVVGLLGAGLGILLAVLACVVRPPPQTVVVSDDEEPLP
jgi:hypothetical protein